MRARRSRSRLIGGYSEEDTREWRASLGAYLLKIGTFWAVLCVLSIYGPLVLVVGRELGGLGGGGRVVVYSFLGAVAGRSDTDKRRQNQQEPAGVRRRDRAAGVHHRSGRRGLGAGGLPPRCGHCPSRYAGNRFLEELSRCARSTPGSSCSGRCTWRWSASSHANINLFGLNAFYANRLVRCYLGASRPREAPKEGRPNFAPTNCPGPVRWPNPITGFDRKDDFPLRDLAIVRSWDRDDLVVDYRGPYHLINTAMNLAAGDELAWQERKAESFILSPLYCGSKTTGYRPAQAS